MSQGLPIAPAGAGVPRWPHAPGGPERGGRAPRREQGAARPRGGDRRRGRLHGPDSAGTVGLPDGRQAPRAGKQGHPRRHPRLRAARRGEGARRRHRRRRGGDGLGARSSPTSRAATLEPVYHGHFPGAGRPAASGHRPLEARSTSTATSRPRAAARTAAPSARSTSSSAARTRVRPIDDVVTEVAASKRRLFWGIDDNIWGVNVKRSIELYAEMAQDRPRQVVVRLGRPRHARPRARRRAARRTRAAPASPRSSSAGSRTTSRSLEAYKAVAKQGRQRRDQLKRIRDHGIEVMLFTMLGGRRGRPRGLRRAARALRRAQGLRPPGDDDAVPWHEALRSVPTVSTTRPRLGQLRRQPRGLRAPDAQRRVSARTSSSTCARGSSRCRASSRASRRSAGAASR